MTRFDAAPAVTYPVPVGVLPGAVLVHVVPPGLPDGVKVVVGAADPGRLAIDPAPGHESGGAPEGLPSSGGRLVPETPEAEGAETVGDFGILDQGIAVPGCPLPAGRPLESEASGVGDAMTDKVWEASAAAGADPEMIEVPGCPSARVEPPDCEAPGTGSVVVAAEEVSAAEASATLV